MAVKDLLGRQRSRTFGPGKDVGQHLALPLARPAADVLPRAHAPERIEAVDHRARGEWQQRLDDGAGLLKGVRGQAGVDFDAIATSLQRISQLVTDFPQIVEMDINPFIVGALGRVSVAADARITLKDVASP